MVWISFLLLNWLLGHSATSSGMVKVTPGHEYLYFGGRFLQSSPEAVHFGWSGSTIVLRFQGTGCQVLFENKSTINDGYGQLQANYFQVTLNGSKSFVLKVENGKTRYTLAQGLPPGEHTIELFKRTEASCGIVTLLGFELDPGGRILPAKPAAKKRKIEFIGDSITCGYGIEGDSARCKFTPATQNNFITYSSLAARALDAEYRTVAFSGIGLYRNYNPGNTQTMPEVYPRYYPQNDSVIWDYRQWQPDVVVINLGTNDFARGVPGNRDFVDKAKAFIQYLKQQYPAAQICVLLSPMVTDAYPRNEKRRTTLATYWQQTLQELRQQGVAGLHYFPLSEQGKVGYGCDFHPNAAQHKRNGEELTGFLRKTFQWH